MPSPQLKYEAEASTESEINLALLDGLMSRRSVSPKRLVVPGPCEVEVRQIVAAALTAPDHCALRPWRFIQISGAARECLGDTFATIKARRDPSSSPDDLERERARALTAPVLITIVARLTIGHPRVRVCEQHMSVGAAIQNMLLCAHALGYGAKMVSGLKVLDPHLANVLGVGSNEQLAGFICLGTQAQPQRKPARPDVDDHLTIWSPSTV